MLSRREMGALCASLLFCLLLSLGAGWAQSQLITADQLAADTRRLHIRADTDSVHGGQPGRCPGVGGGKPRPLRADGPPDTGRSRHPRTGESLPHEYVLSHPAL